MTVECDDNTIDIFQNVKWPTRIYLGKCDVFVASFHYGIPDERIVLLAARTIEQ